MIRNAVIILLFVFLLHDFLLETEAADFKRHRRTARRLEDGSFDVGDKGLLFIEDGSDDVGDKESFAETYGGKSHRVEDIKGSDAESEHNIETPSGRVPLDEINNEKESSGQWPSFLSTTLNMRLHPVLTTMNSARQAIFATAVTRFLNKVFDGQSTYDIAVRSVSVIQQDQVSAQSRVRRLAERRTQQEIDLIDSLDVEVVVAAQYVEANSKRSLSSEDFGKLLLRIFNKFEEHLIQYMREMEEKKSGGDLEDVYFASIEDVVVESYLVAVAKASESSMPSDDEERDGMDTTSIIAIVLGSLGLAAFTAALFIKLSWEGKLGIGGSKGTSQSRGTASFGTSNKIYNIQDIVHKESFTHVPNEKVIKSMGSSGSSTSKKKKQNIFRKKDGGKDTFEGRIAKFDLSTRYGKSENDDGQANGGSRFSTDESILKTEMERVIRRREFTAPPGKLGVAIDSVNGHPVVHRIKEGSPLVGVLKRLDRIVSIDGIDTSNMSAADVTYLMVKGMNKPRKITYIREE